jgi:5-methylcytosine-specific restriction endonuclease McrA
MSGVAYKDPERARAYGREWMKRNPQKARDAVRRWNKSHPEQRRAAKRLYYARHREQHKAVMAAYHKAHPEVLRAKSNAYRARARAAEGQFTSAEWRALVESYGGKCAYRGEAGPVQVDHRTPLTRGGRNSIDNILPACQKCNTEKGQLTEEEFRARLAAEDAASAPADRRMSSQSPMAG